MTPLVRPSGANDRRSVITSEPGWEYSHAFKIREFSDQGVF
ncbi:MAG: hypothetical protein V1934_00365 [Methanobacteriota archaeon]